MKTSYYADRLCNLLLTAHKADGGKITLTQELSEFVVNEMYCLVEDIRLLENTAISEDARNMAPPIGENVVCLTDFRKKGK